MEKKSLKNARKEAGYLTQGVVAEILGLTTATISNYETGKTSPTYHTARKMAELYGRNVDELDFGMGKCSAKSNKER